MRRIAVGGTVACLHRPSGQPWFLHDLKRATFEPKGEYIAINSPADFSGFSVELLGHAIDELWKRNNSK